MAAAAWNNSFWRSRFVIVTFWILSTWALEGERGERKLFSTPWGEGRRVLLNGHKLGFFKPREKRKENLFFRVGFLSKQKREPFWTKITKTYEGNVFPLFWRSRHLLSGVVISRESARPFFLPPPPFCRTIAYFSRFGHGGIREGESWIDKGETAAFFFARTVVK